MNTVWESVSYIVMWVFRTYWWILRQLTAMVWYM